MTQLGEALATLERLLDEQGVPSDSTRPEERPEATAPEESRDPSDSIPLLNDVVTPLERSPQAPGSGPEPLRVVPPIAADVGGGGEIGEGADGEDDFISFKLTPPEPFPPSAGAPGSGPPRASKPATVSEERYFDAPTPVLAPEQYRHLVNRLANEIDVLVQAGAEEAVRAAAQDIADKVRKHVAIVLPEIIEELTRMSSRPRE